MHEQRVKQELKAVGVTRFGFMKFAINYLPKIIHKDEHIHGVVYGRYGEKTGSLTLVEGMLVATDHRIIFVDHKPGYTSTDEITYEVVSGIKTNKAFFSAVTLHTRIGDYTIGFANSRCAAKFTRYVEKRRLESNKKSNNKTEDNF